MAAAIDKAASLVKGSWSAGDWGPCSKACGTGTRLRAVTCMLWGSPVTVSDSVCTAADKPAVTSSCNTQACGLPAACPAACTQDMRDNAVCDPECNVAEWVDVLAGVLLHVAPCLALLAAHLTSPHPSLLPAYQGRSANHAPAGAATMTGAASPTRRPPRCPTARPPPPAPTA